MRTDSSPPAPRPPQASRRFASPTNAASASPLSSPSSAAALQPPSAFGVSSIPALATSIAASPRVLSSAAAVASARGGADRDAAADAATPTVVAPVPVVPSETAPPPTPASAPAAPSASEGGRVRVKLPGWRKWYPGIVAAENRDGSYAVLLDNGERHDGVTGAQLFLLDTTADQHSRGSKSSSISRPQQRSPPRPPPVPLPPPQASRESEILADNPLLGGLPGGGAASQRGDAAKAMAEAREARGEPPLYPEQRLRAEEHRGHRAGGAAGGERELAAATERLRGVMVCVFPWMAMTAILKAAAASRQLRASSLNASVWTQLRFAAEDGGDWPGQRWGGGQRDTRRHRLLGCRPNTTQA